MFDQQIIDRYTKLYSALVSDCCEAAGLGPRAAAAGLVPFHRDDLRVSVGAAYPSFVRRTRQHVEIEKLLAMVEATPPHSVAVVGVDEDIGAALWGGLVATSTRRRGCLGAIVDGGVRDLHTVIPLDFPVWAMYRSPLDIRGRGEMVHFGEPVMFRGVSVDPGDLVFADANGAVFVPKASVIDVLALCEERVTKEVITERELQQGASPAEVYSRHGAF